jgi:hypothetical protein
MYGINYKPASRIERFNLKNVFYCKQIINMTNGHLLFIDILTNAVLLCVTTDIKMLPTLNY